MKFFYLVISLILSCCIILACKSNQDKSTDPDIESSLSHSDLLAKYFKGSALAEINQLITIFKEQTKSGGKSIKESYDMHSHQLRSDTFQNLPRSISYPYNQTSGIETMIPQGILYNIWNNDCAFAKEEEELSHYYCLNLEGPFIAFLQDKGKNNGVFKKYHEQLLRSQGMSTELDEMMVLQSSEQLDFSNSEDCLLYLVHHYTVYEEMTKSKKM